MSSIARRAASKLVRIIERALDPAAEPDRVQLYSKDLAGVSRLYARDSNGQVTQLTPILVVDDEGVPVGQRPEINFIGGAVTVVDDPGNNRVNVTIAGAIDVAPAVLGFGCGNIGAAAGTRFLDPWFGAVNEVAGVTIIQKVAPRNGTLRDLLVIHNTANGNGNSVVYTVMKNGVPTLLTVTLATGAIGQASDLVNTVAVLQGDRIGLRANKANAIGNGQIETSVTMSFVA